MLGTAHPIRNRDQLCAITHVASVEPSAIDLERLCQRADPMIRRGIGRGRQQIADALDENLQVMNATQEILRRSQRPNRSRRPLMSRLRQDLRRVQEFIHRDADHGGVRGHTPHRRPGSRI